MPQALEDGAFALFKDIANAKKDRENGSQHRDILATPDLRDHVRARYDVYAAARSCLETLSPYIPAIGLPQQEALKSCYGSVKLQPVKASLLLAQPPEICATCPYCGIGEIGQHEAEKATDRLDEWDHYFPQAKYPEYSALPINLIPCCSKCNRKKGDTVIKNGQRCILHFYFDQFDHREAFLTASITFEDGPSNPPRVKYAFLPTVCNRPFGSLFVRHCIKLDLRRRYSSKAREQIPTTVRSLKRRHPNTAEAIVEVLEGCAADETEARGANHWTSLFYRAAASSADFIDYCRRTP